MRTRLLAPLAALVLMAGSTAHAGGFVEPVLGWHFGKFSIEDLAPAMDTDTSFNGPGVGLRAGLTLGKSFWLAAEGHYASVKNEDDKRTNYLSVGADLGVLIKKFRLWGGVNFINQFQEPGSTVAVKGLGYKAGAGFMLAKSVSLNVEYLINPITKSCDDGDCRDFEDVAADASLSGNSVFVSLSFPFGLSSK